MNTDAIVGVLATGRNVAGKREDSVPGCLTPGEDAIWTDCATAKRARQRRTEAVLHGVDDFAVAAPYYALKNATKVANYKPKTPSLQ